MYVHRRADLAEQTVQTGDLLLQVFGLNHQLAADSLGLLLWVQREDQLRGAAETQTSVLLTSDIINVTKQRKSDASVTHTST